MALLLAREAWRLLHAARSLLHNWKRLPPDRQGELRGGVRQVGSLTVELSGALRDRGASPERPVAQIVAELGAVMEQLQTAAPELGAGLELRTRRAKFALKTAQTVGGSVTRRATTRPRGANDDGMAPEEPGTAAELDATAAAFAELADGSPHSGEPRLSP